VVSAGTGKSHLLVGLGRAAVAAGHRVRYFAAADLVESLYHGLADNSVARIIDGLLRSDLVILDELGLAPLDATGTQLLFRFVAAAYERRSLALASHFPFDQWGRFLPEQTTAASMLDRLLFRRRNKRRSRSLPRASRSECGRHAPEAVRYPAPPRKEVVGS
jgi:DNA replication protein DnaC